MTYTDSGRKVEKDWIPLAAANGIEWMELRREHPDRFKNLYRKTIINVVLWYVGAVLTLAFPSIARCIETARKDEP